MHSNIIKISTRNTRSIHNIGSLTRRSLSVTRVQAIITSGSRRRKTTANVHLRVRILAVSIKRYNLKRQNTRKSRNKFGDRVFELSVVKTYSPLSKSNSSHFHDNPIRVDEHAWNQQKRKRPHHQTFTAHSQRTAA